MTTAIRTALGLLAGLGLGLILDQAGHIERLEAELAECKRAATVQQVMRCR
jgi:hypothetical protein